MIGVWCLANICRVLFSIFRSVDSVNEALERHKDGEGWFIGKVARWAYGCYLLGYFLAYSNPLGSL